MKRLLCFLLSFSCFFFGACTEGEKNEFQTVLDSTNALHKAQISMVSESSIRDFIPSLPRTEVGFTEAELASLTKSLNRLADESKSVTIDQAKQDVDLLFRALRYCYGPYGYFGGDEAFDKAQTAVLDDLSVFGASFQIGKLIESLREHLSFLQDAHFTINGKSLVDRYSYFSSEEPEFAHDEAGYYAVLDGYKQYISSINGATDVEAYMKYSISMDGKLVYYIGTLSTQTEKQLSITVSFENGMRELTLSKVVDRQTYDTKIPYSADWNAVVPVVACRDYMQQSTFQSFVEDASWLSSEPTAILDLRGNRGGSEQAVQAWLNSYDYYGIARNLYGKGYFSISSRASNYLTAHTLSAFSSLGNSAALYDELIYLYQHGKNSCVLQRDNAKLRWNNAKKLLFVLMDSHTRSGGEWLLESLRTRGNTVFIGTNSEGMLLSGTGQYISLPNSKIHFSFGNSLLLSYDERVFEEGRGFLPDLWVSGDALERVQKLIEYYGLAPQANAPAQSPTA